MEFLICSDPSSLLGVRLPPDTEIIKYTSSIVGPKIPGTTNRGRKKTISLDPNPLLAFPGLSPAKRARLEMEYAAAMGQVAAAAAAVSSAPSVSSTGGSSSSSSSSSIAPPTDRVEVIKLPPTITSNGAYNLSNKMLKESSVETTGVNLSIKNTTPTAPQIEDSDAPLNLSMKPDNKASSDYSSSTGTNSLQSLSSITAALGSGSGSSGNSGSGGDRSSNYKEGRPRNLGRGVSKPKKNTVASLLAQSRAVGIKPMLATQQLLNQGADIVRFY